MDCLATLISFIRRIERAGGKLLRIITLPRMKLKSVFTSIGEIDALECHESYTQRMQILRRE